MDKAEKNKKFISKSKLIKWIISVGFILYAVISIVNMQIVLRDKKGELDTLRVQLEYQRMENQEMARRIQAGVDEGEIERIAREQLKFVSPDEKVFIDISGS